MRKNTVFVLGLFLALALVLPAYAVYGESPVVSDPLDQVNFAISGRRTVVWVDKRAGNWDIYQARIDINPPAIDDLQPIPGATVNNSWAPVSAEVVDKGVGVDQASVHVYLDGADITAGANINGGLVQ
ncbi:hypothetical protein BMS3Abin01_00793 [bacterium BMS3Abin01]|nr:hypothetical protein BMS3Abin01_00793 [bacterium BMS3Abin01]HDY69837.1 hypothetical protein [Actinomycetota bacterium]